MIFTFNNMKYLVFDTETTGLPPRRINYSNPNWETAIPYIVQLSWILYDSENDNIEGVYDYIIKMKDGINIPDVVANIHGITNEISRMKGVDISVALLEFEKCLKQTDILIAHNLEFDKKFIMAELKRNNFVYDIDAYGYNEYCTMQNSIKLCNIVKYNSMGPYLKYPKLIELHKHLFGCEPDNLHNSLVDVIVCMRCYLMITQEKDLYIVSDTFKELYNKLCDGCLET